MLSWHYEILPRWIREYSFQEEIDTRPIVKPNHILKIRIFWLKKIYIYILAKQCKTFLTIAYYTDSWSFKMSIENIINQPFNVCFCLLNIWLICLIRSFAPSKFFPFAADSFSNFKSWIHIKHYEVYSIMLDTKQNIK